MIHKNEKKHKEDDKTFVEGPSILTTLFEKDVNMKSLRHLAWAVTGLAIADSVFRSGRGSTIARKGFYGTSTAIPLWILMQTIVFAAHLLVNLRSRLRIVWYISFMSTFGIVIWNLQESVGIAWRFALLFEQIRFVMKVHSYWTRNELKLETLPPTFKRFVYFLFAPTLLYRSSYLRSPGPVNWMNVLGHLIEVCGGVFLTGFNLEGNIGPLVSVTREERGFLYWRTFGAATLPSLAQLMVGHYLLLHAWQNAWAEALRFADRRFYSDWWLAGSYTEYYRKWNGIVHNWLREYVYDTVLNRGSSRLSAALAVFSVSALVHEYIIGAALGFIYPVMFFQFAGLGVLFAMLKPSDKLPSSTGNVFVWMSLSTGSAMMMILYAAEMHARTVCPAYPNRLLDPFIPRSWYCDL